MSEVQRITGWEEKDIDDFVATLDTLLDDGLTEQAFFEYSTLQLQAELAEEVLQRDKSRWYEHYYIRTKEALRQYRNTERNLTEEVESLALRYERLTRDDPASLHRAVRAEVATVRGMAEVYAPELEERLSLALRKPLLRRRLRTRYDEALNLLESRELQPKRRGARTKLRELKDEFLDIANTSPERDPLRQEANEAYRLASTKYEEATSSYKRRFYIKAGLIAAGLAAATFFTLATIRHYAATNESPLAPLLHPPTITEQYEPDRQQQYTQREHLQQQPYMPSPLPDTDEDR